jgi:hypothetical protein
VALDLGGDFYNRGKRNRSDYDAFLDDVHVNLYDDDDAFQDCLSEYYRKLMGSQDICCCPLCYIESHQRLANLVSGEEEDSDEERREQHQGFHCKALAQSYSMTVLGFPDNDRYNVASMFCFTKMADVKRHL